VKRKAKAKPRAKRLPKNSPDPYNIAYAESVLAMKPTRRPLPTVEPVPLPPPVVGAMLPNLPAKLAEALRELAALRQQKDAALAPLVNAVEKLPVSHPYSTPPKEIEHLRIEAAKWFARERVAELAVAKIRADIRQSLIAGAHQRMARRNERLRRELGWIEDPRLVPWGSRPEPSERLRPKPLPPAKPTPAEQTLEAWKQYLQSERQ
jgi:hypothetical protein